VHPWVTENGRKTMGTMRANKIEVTEKDLSQVFSKVRKITRVLMTIRRGLMTKHKIPEGGGSGDNLTLLSLV